MAKNYSSLLLASEQELPDCATTEASSLFVSIVLPQPTHNEASAVQQHKGERWLVVHLSIDQQKRSGGVCTLLHQEWIYFRDSLGHERTDEK